MRGTISSAPHSPRRVKCEARATRFYQKKYLFFPICRCRITAAVRDVGGSGLRAGWKPKIDLTLKCLIFKEAVITSPLLQVLQWYNTARSKRRPPAADAFSCLPGASGDGSTVCGGFFFLHSLDSNYAASRTDAKEFWSYRMNRMYLVHGLC
jgi:hypothetical protein